MKSDRMKNKEIITAFNEKTMETIRRIIKNGISYAAVEVLVK